jgi:hypothetical protein
MEDFLRGSISNLGTSMCTKNYGGDYFNEEPAKLNRDVALQAV